MQKELQLFLRKRLANFKAVASKAQMQQARSSFGLMYFRRMLEDQHIDLVGDRCNPAADACALRPQAG